MRLEKSRPCDGKCCQVMPLRKIDREGSQDCFFRDPSLPERGCTVMTNPNRLSEMSEREQHYFKMACAAWPQNETPETQGDFGECCWRWVE